ncbi:acyl carrier protein [Streptomyces sp. NPDC029526]|uniref:acyl carrier protein n=1 Tax=Streptomyces sp. NPDC029526 TaxID=3155728 RepID=UPI00340ED223
MAVQESITLQAVVRALRTAAGAGDGVDLDGDIADVTFSELGYDSIAVLETVGALEREYGFSLGDEAVHEAQTPGQLLRLVAEAAGEATGLAA